MKIYAVVLGFLALFYFTSCEEVADSSEFLTSAQRESLLGTKFADIDGEPFRSIELATAIFDATDNTVNITLKSDLQDIDITITVYNIVDGTQVYTAEEINPLDPNFLAIVELGNEDYYSDLVDDLTIGELTLTYNSSEKTVSGTFNFPAIDLDGVTTINVTNGSFSNVSIF